MALEIGDRTVRREVCPTCGAGFEHVTGFVTRDGVAHAAYYAACHGSPEHVAQIDVILGRWGDAATPTDRSHFACILRADGAMAVDAPLAVAPETDWLGPRLTREQALVHGLVAEFWAVVDLIAVADPSVGAAVDGRSAG